MATFLKNKLKYDGDRLVSAFLKEFSKKTENQKKEINVNTKSSDIAKIISKKLLEKIEKDVVLK